MSDEKRPVAVSIQLRCPCGRWASAIAPNRQPERGGLAAAYDHHFRTMHKPPPELIGFAADGTLVLPGVRQ